METQKITRLKRELKLKEFQFNSIYEFSASIYSSFQIDNIIRVFFSTLMGQMGVSKAFFFDSANHLFKRKGLKLTNKEIDYFKKNIKKVDDEWFYSKVDDMAENLGELKAFLLSKKIHYLVNISESKRKKMILGLGLRFNREELTIENIEFSFFVSRFALIAIENTFLINRIIESKRIEHEMRIARDIQLSLLPQKVPELKNFEIFAIYEPINEVGGDYYDILKKRNGMLPVLIADVEGKGLSAALLAASSQAIFHSLNELYFFEPAKFISKANSLIYDFTKGNRFITLFWQLLNDEDRTVSYVNAGHIEPLLIKKNKVEKLSKGGILTGFVGEAEYENGTIKFSKGDIAIVFTDGVPEVENPDGKEFGSEAMVDFVKKNRNLSAKEIAEGLFSKIKGFSQNKKFRDDFTLIILKAI